MRRLAPRPEWRTIVGILALSLLTIATVLMVVTVINRDLAVSTTADATGATSATSATGDEIPPATPTDKPQARDLVEGIESVLIIGDGTAMVGGLEPGWAGQLATKRGWQLTNLARAGTGFNVDLSGEDCPVESCPSFLGSIVPALAADASPELIIVSGGGWDGLQDLSTRRAAAAAFFSSLRANFRNAGIVALSPMWLDEPLPAPLGPVRKTVRDEVTRVGGAYLDVGSPFQNLPDGADPLTFNDQANVTVLEAIEQYLDGLVTGG
ncbi:MAG: hypothetical protein WB471_02010 [Nocardioides sp.]